MVVPQVVVFPLFVLFGRIWIVLAQYSYNPPDCDPKYPSMMQPAGGIHTPLELNGDWYTYRHLTALRNVNSTVNQRVQFASSSQAVDTLSGEPARTLYALFAGYDSADTRICHSRTWTGLYIQDGRMIGTAAASEDIFILKPANYAVLYRDYQKLFVAYACYHVPEPDGSCRLPDILVLTRAKPTELSATESEGFDAILNGILRPHCVKAAQIPKAAYSDDFPFCRFDAFANECSFLNLRGLGVFNISFGVTLPVTSVSPDDGTTSRCQLPNFILKGVPYDPFLALGLWYGYRFRFIETDVNNMQYTWNFIGNGTLPFSTTAAALEWMEYFFTNSSGCQNRYYVGAIGINGRTDGLFGPVTPMGERIVMKLTVLHFDGASALYYGCAVPDPFGSNCYVPFVLAGLRQEPTTVASELQSQLDGIINSALRTYGCSAADIPLVGQMKEAPKCVFQEAENTGIGTGCAHAHIKGLCESWMPPFRQLNSIC